MRNAWNEVRLSDVAVVNELSIRGNIHSIGYIDIASITTGQYPKPVVMPMSEAPSRARRVLRQGDTVISSVRPNLKAYFYAKSVQENTICSTGFAVITPKKVDSRYLYYTLTNDNYIDFLSQRANGAAYPAVSFDTFASSKINLPPLPIQRRIADILGALDDKIECNRRMNETLEKMAEALYQHWFVDFGPFRDGEFVDSEMGRIPKGWEVKPIGEVVNTLGGGTPSTSEPGYWDNGDINWYSPTDLTTTKTLFIKESSKKITPKGLSGSSARLFPPFSVMITSRATIGEIAINCTEACTNQGFITIIPNELISIYQIYFWLKQNMHEIHAKANGSTFKEITRSIFRSFLIPVAPGIDQYLQQSRVLFDQIKVNILASQTLARTRDYLLPKLLAGEIEVKEAL